MKKLLICLLLIITMLFSTSCGLLFELAEQTGEIKSAQDIEADTWYTYSQINALKFQNCIIDNAFAKDNGVIVSYYPVCKECYAKPGVTNLATPEFNYDINKNYTCSECFAVTTVRLKLS